jgi:hypothetical protein
MGQSPRSIALTFVLLIAGLYLAAGPVLQLGRWQVEPTANHGWIEANAWLGGRLDIPHRDGVQIRDRLRDSALFDGKVYNVFPPLFTFISCAAIWLQKIQASPDLTQLTFFPTWYVALVVVPLPIVGYWAFLRITKRADLAALFTAYWVLGTPLLKMLANCRIGSTNELNHVFANIGLMLIAGDLLGRRRIWPAAIGLVIGLWSRQLIALYLPAIVWMAWRADSGRSRKIAYVLAATCIGFGAIAILNYLKFGNPLDSGYGYIYEARADLYAQRYREFGQTFHPGFMPGNAYWMNLALPELCIVSTGPGITGEGDGTGFWIGSPLLLFVFRDVRRWWVDPSRRILMLCSLAVIVGILCYHTTGSVQRGFYRFALDYIPIWLAAIAPYFATRDRLHVLIGCLAYSALYFNLVCQMP